MAMTSSPVPLIVGGNRKGLGDMILMKLCSLHGGCPRNDGVC